MESLAKKKKLKREDGSRSPRGLWDNIRDNRGSGRKPTPEMLEQAEKIRKARASVQAALKKVAQL